MAVDRYECLKVLTGLLEEDDIVVNLGIGATHFELWQLRPAPSSASMGKLGGTVALGLGIAIALPDNRVVVVTTDGDLLMELGQLSPIADQDPKNLKIIVLDNQYYESLETPRPTLTAGKLDLAGIAKASGIKKTATVDSLEEFETLLTEWLEISEPVCLVVKTNRGKSNAPERLIDHIEDKYRFVRWVEQRHGLDIIPKKS